MENKKVFVIVGNGFDLAHNDITKFSDFARWLTIYFAKQIRRYDNDSPYFGSKYINDFINTRVSILNSKRQNPNKIIHDSVYDKILELILDENFIEFDKKMQTNEGFLEYFFSNQFLLNLFKIKSKNPNWFDIEETYFNNLKDYALKNTYNSIGVNDINKTLNFLKVQFGIYLNEIKILKKASIVKFLTNEIGKYEEATVIDFNYTETFKKYTIGDKIPATLKNAAIINIHGTVRNNNMVFGYGNDRDSEYKLLKNLNKNEALDNMKTFQYIMDNKYSQFVDQLEQGIDFDVMVLGHSLGLTDKTLLQNVFDNKHCKKILLYKRKKSDQVSEKQIYEYFKNTSMNLSRIMNDEDMARKKIVNYLDARTFP